MARVMTTSFLVLALAVLIAFLGLLGGLSVAVTKTVNPDGRVSRGFFGALGSVLALLFLSGVGLLGTGVFVAAVAIGTAIDKNPIHAIEIGRDGNEFTSGLEFDDEHPMRVRFWVEGDGGRDLLALVENVLGVDRRELERVLTVRPHESGVSDVAVYEFRLPLTEGDLVDLEREIARELDGLEVRLPDRVRIIFDQIANG